MKRSRRVLSHHGSDCPSTPHPIRQHRCIILTRIDHGDGTSTSWCSGDCAETMPYRGERVQRKRHTFAAEKPIYYGGAFWEAVMIPPRA